MSNVDAQINYTGPPHPDYPNMVWSIPEAEGAALAAIEKSSTSGEAAVNIQAVLEGVGYDSMDREMAFWIATQTKGWDYEDIYQAWLNAPR
jgi:hypothetical protein